MSGKKWVACPCLGTLAITILLSTSERVSAALISVDDSVFGVDSITRDTVNNLDWLDVTKSVNRSYDDVRDQFGVGGDFAGFRYAVLDDIEGLLESAAVGPPTWPVFVTPAEQGVIDLVTFLGITDTRAGSHRMHGFYDAEEVPTDIKARALSLFLLEDASASTVYFDGWFVDKDEARDYAGSLLVRETTDGGIIPEPSTLIIWSLLGALGFTVGWWRCKGKL